MVEKRPALGRGLSALIPDSPAPAAPPVADRSLEIDIDLLRPNQFQPRTHIDDDADRGAVALDPRQRHHPADRRRARSTRATRSSPASAAGAPRSAPAC